MSDRWRYRRRRVLLLDGTQDLRSLLDIPRRDPAQRAESPVGCDGVDGRYVDLRISEFANDVRDRANAVVTLIES